MQVEKTKIEDHKVKVVIDIDMTLGQLSTLKKICNLFEYKNLSDYFLEATLDQCRRDCDRFPETRQELKVKLGVDEVDL